MSLLLRAIFHEKVVYFVYLLAREIQHSVLSFVSEGLKTQIRLNGKTHSALKYVKFKSSAL